VDACAKAKQEVLEYNPYGTAPVLVDRDLVLFKADIIAEYLDERFPHPPLLPVYPVLKARSRLMIHRINKDWYPLMNQILDKTVAESKKTALRKELVDSLVSVNSAFAENTFFLSEEFSLVDCCVAPLLWRLPLMGIQLPSNAEAITEYANKIFNRDSFQASLTASEKNLRN
jgi:RNA polymerase-associated protein